MKQLSILVLIMFTTAAASAQQYLRPQWNGCIARLDANGMQIRNNCSIRLSVQGAPRVNDTQHQSWQVDVDANSSTWTAWGTQGYELYVCPSGYTAVDSNGNIFSSSIADFQCKRF